MHRMPWSTIAINAADLEDRLARSDFGKIGRRGIFTERHGHHFEFRRSGAAGPAIEELRLTADNLETSVAFYRDMLDMYRCWSTARMRALCSGRTGPGPASRNGSGRRPPPAAVVLPARVLHPRHCRDPARADCARRVLSDTSYPASARSAAAAALRIRRVTPVSLSTVGRMPHMGKRPEGHRTHAVKRRIKCCRITNRLSVPVRN